MGRPKGNPTFHERVASNTTVDPRTGCFEFNGHRDETGYGRIRRNGRLVRVHKALFQDRNGPLAEGIYALHRCDNRACWNPDHIYAGTHRQNTQDMMDRGRHVPSPGESNGSAKLTEEQAIGIRARLRAGEKGAHLAREFGVTPTQISRIKLGKSWSHVA